MKKKDDSFWSDIKALDERLKREPDSFCFARLAEIYLKVGLVTDAVHTARTGVAKHPGYLAGQRVLALACNASGLHDESRALLEQVTAAMPEDVDAQKILAGLYVAAGDNASAIRTYRTVLDFRPDDRGSAIDLETLQSGAIIGTSEHSLIGQAFAPPEVFVKINKDDEIIELKESDIFEEPVEERISFQTLPVAGVSASDHHDPLSTLTLAELYEQQGFLSKAIAIYRTILADDPTNAKLLAKIAQLEGNEPVSGGIPEETVDAGFEESEDVSEPVAYEQTSVPLESQILELISASIAADTELESFSSGTYGSVLTKLEDKDFAALANKTADNVVDTLGGWLENIRRIKACR